MEKFCEAEVTGKIMIGKNWRFWTKSALFFSAHNFPSHDNTRLPGTALNYCPLNKNRNYQLPLTQLPPYTKILKMVSIFKNREQVYSVHCALYQFCTMPPYKCAVVSSAVTTCAGMEEAGGHGPPHFSATGGNTF